MTPFAALAGGGLAGFAGGLLAHVITIFAVRHGSESWLRGPYGPPFFNVALYTGIFYGVIGLAAGRKPLTGTTGFLGAFFAILSPLFVLTRYGGWGMAAGEAITPAWQAAVVIVYACAIWGAIAAIGFSVRSWRGGAAAVLGSLAGYAVLKIFLAAFSSWAKTPWDPTSYIPSPVNLLDGLLSGAGLCLGLSLEERFSRRPS
ncbi:MAG: hypothetical protein KGL74_06425 [Elusimicrobia bacterium]|nr:hypothetical protein [Elusimicrobiota bacterium]MDE2510739.1 hypothetical protein [Elusimicrobiota bacterium]